MASDFSRTTCPICGGTTYKRLFPIDIAYAEGISGFRLPNPAPSIERCLSCKHEMIQPVPSAAFLTAFYAGYMSKAKNGFYREQATPEISQAFRSRYEPWLLEIKGRTPTPASLLDVGAGLGTFLRLARQHGFVVEGIEPNQEAAAALTNNHQVRVHCCSLEEFVPNENKYDVVCMWDLLEHLPDPRLALAKVSGLLSKNGVLIFELPVRDSLLHALAKLVYRSSFGLVQRPLYLVSGIHHLQYFSQQSMCKLLDDCGFDVERVFRVETNILGLQKRIRGSLLSRITAVIYNSTLRMLMIGARALRYQNKIVVFAHLRDA